MLGQIFKFFEYQSEGIRNRIAKSFSALYAETHETPRKISSRELRLAYDHIKDFRNNCAHEERLYCSRVSPARDIVFARMLDDLPLVLTKNENTRMRGELLGLLHKLTGELGGSMGEQVLHAMGFANLDEVAFSVT